MVGVIYRLQWRPLCYCLYDRKKVSSPLQLRCHSRFCPTCGNMYSIDRTTSMSFKIINVQHRHCVFTIARELRSLEQITFHYNRHEDEKLVIETIPVLDFIARLTQHIPEKHFKMIRYYGIYARHRKSDKYLRRAISREKHKILLSFNQWRESILLSFGYDPLKCPSCGTTMLFLELYFNHKPVPLHELYEKVMRKHPCRSPASLSHSPVTWYNQSIYYRNGDDHY